MNVYFAGMCMAMAFFVLISYVVGKKVRGAEDFYIAGRSAPLILVVGSMVASYTSSGMFMGDAAEAYEGALSSMLLFASMQSAGYIVGAAFLGRYLRRSGAITIPEFFGMRFCSQKMRTISAVTAIIMMTVYLLSVIQGMGTLMNLVTGVDYSVCIILIVVAFTLITVISGSRGVLITDTVMAFVFTISMFVAIVFIANEAGGWYTAIEALASDPTTGSIFSWAGTPGALYDTGFDNILWSFFYGIVWMSVCAVAPWQSSRYMMADSEHTVIRSAPLAALGVFILEFFICTTAVIINIFHPEIASSSHVWIWAAMNLIPVGLGILLITGVLSAGISSATTFLSLIGASVAKDIFVSEGRKSITHGRIAMCVASGVVLICALFNPPAIFVIMFLGGATAASSWMPVAIGCILSKKITKTGAFYGMLFGMLGCLGANLLQSVGGVSLPVWLDPAIVGMGCNVLAIIIGSMFTHVTPEEIEAHENLFIVPESEKNEKEIRKTLVFLKAGYAVGMAMTVILLSLWVVPYLIGRA